MGYRGSACPILPTYRTTDYTMGPRLSDSCRLSDYQLCIPTMLVRILLLIGQPAECTPKKQGLSANETILVSTFLSMQFVAYVVFHIAGFVL